MLPVTYHSEEREEQSREMATPSCYNLQVELRGKYAEFPILSVVLHVVDGLERGVGNAITN